MKKLSVMILLIAVTAGAQAQAPGRYGRIRNTSSDDVVYKNRGFSKDNLFVGGSVQAGFGSGTTELGIGPYLGVSLNKYLDFAGSLNYDYISQQDYYSPAKFRQSVISPGAFIRLFPVKFLYAQAQYEHNFIQQKVLYGTGIPDDKFRYEANSFLIGPGLASGRGEGKTYFYISVLFDVAKDLKSPYLDNYGRVEPIIRAGINVSLSGDKRSNEDRGRGRRFHRRGY